MKTRCKECNETAATRAGLAAHMRWNHNLKLDGTQWRAAKKAKEVATEPRRVYRTRTNGIPVNGTLNTGTAYSISAPSNPIRHLETAAVEIQERLTVINRELENVKRLEVERSSLSFQLGQIEQILNPTNQAPNQTPKETVRELAHA